MILLVVKAECKKLKKSPIWIAFLVLPIITAIMGTFNYTANIEILTNGWYSLWTQHSLFASFLFFPVILGLICAYEWRLEHFGNNWNSLMTQPTTVFALFFGKLIVSSIYAIGVLLFIGFLYVMCGYLVGFRTFPWGLLYWITLGIFGSVATIAVQLLLSMIVKNFAIPVGISLVGGFIGLAMISNGTWWAWPYALISVGLHANQSEVLKGSDLIVYFISAFVFVILSIVKATSVLDRKDIDTM